MTNTQVPNIPPPPSGGISDTDPLAQNAGSIPPPPSGGISDTDPLKSSNAGARTPTTAPEDMGFTGFEGAEYSKGSLSEIGKGAGSEAGGIAKGALLGGVPSVVQGLYQDVTKNLPATVRAYEQARSSGKSVMDSYAAMNAKAKEIQQAKLGLNERIKEFSTNPDRATGRAIVDGILATLGGLSLTELLPEAPATAEMATAEAVAPEAAVEAKAAVPTSPIESAVTKATAKSGLPAGKPATVAPTAEDIQPTLQQGIRDTVNKVAEENGLNPVTKSIRDIGKELGDQFYARSKDTFKQVQDATGVNPTEVQNKICTLNDKIEAAVDDPEKAGQLEQQKLSLENTAEKAFNDAKAKGIDVEQARSDWKKYNASYEFGQHVRASAEGTMNAPTINPNKLAPRLQKFSESTSPTQAGRLQQLAGEDNAVALVEHAENARTAIHDIKEFKPSSPTGQKALDEIVRNNTEGKSSIARGGKVIGKTDWNGVVKNFENLTPEEQTLRFGNDVPKVRQYLGRQALKQNTLKLLKYGAGVGTAEEVVRRGINAVSGSTQ